MSEDNPEIEKSQFLTNQAQPGFTPFAEFSNMGKFVHLSAPRLQKWAKEEGVKLSLSPDQERDGVVLLGYIEEEHLGILAEALGLDYNNADKWALMNFGTTNAGHIIKVGSEYKIGGASSNLVDESAENIALDKKHNPEKAREMDQKTLEALNRVYKGKYQFTLL
jgi:hypothetical protein